MIDYHKPSTLNNLTLMTEPIRRAKQSVYYFCYLAFGKVRILLQAMLVVVV